MEKLRKRYIREREAYSKHMLMVVTLFGDSARFTLKLLDKGQEEKKEKVENTELPYYFHCLVERHNHPSSSESFPEWP